VIRYGIVGIGGFATTWLRSLDALEREGAAKLSAAVVRNPDKYASQVAALRQAGCAIYPSLDAMLTETHGRIDVVGVPTGIADHVPMAAAAMQAGYPALIEKPVCATIQDALHLVAVEQQTGQWCAVGYQWIYSPTIQWLRQRLASGELGQIRQAKTRIGWPRADRYYARNPWAGQLRIGDRWVLDGPATNATAHYLTNMLYLCAAADPAEARILRVRGELYRARDIESYDTSAIELYLAGGAKLLHLATHAMRETVNPEMDITTEHADIHWDASTTRATIRHHNGRIETHEDADPAANHQRPLAHSAKIVAGQAERPLCGLTEGTPHVLAINLAFESSRGVHSMPPGQTQRTTSGQDGAIVCVIGMEEALDRAYQETCTFSDLQLSWAQVTSPANAEGYAKFPRDPKLPARLGVSE
jgi:predicted dehydrogenase